jgi:hypothetical protein
LFNIDSFGNIYFPAGVSVGNYPIVTTTPTHVLVSGVGGRISRVATSQLISNTDVTSVFGRKGDVIALPGDYTSEMVKEVRNLYFTNGRARAAISLTALGTSGPATYNPVTGVINVPQYQNEFNGVTTFNGRAGAVTLTALDVTTALTYTPLASESDPIWTAQKPLYYTKVETESYVTTQISNLVDSAPTTLNTLNELAAALGDDANFSTTITNLIGTKEPAITPGTTAQYWRGDKTWQTLPIYTLAGLGGVPTTRTLTINGTGYDLSADRSWTINSMVYPGAGIAVSTGSAWGTSITDNSSNWNTAFSDRMKWDGGATGLNAATGRASLGLGTAATANTGDFAAASHTHIIGNISGLQTALDGKEPTITGGTTSQYWRGDKTWQTLPVYTLSGLGGQPQLNGTGFVKASGTTISYDNSTYYLASNPAGYITSASIGNGTLTLNVSGNGLSGSTSFTANQSGGSTFTVTSNASTSATANTLVYRDSAADIYTRYFFGSYINTSDNDESGITRFVIKNGDNYHRSATTTVAADVIRGVASGTWSIAITGNAGSITNQANSATITASTGVNANHIVQRDANGYIYANYINFSTSESENPTISSFFTSNGDGWSRKSSLAHVRNQLGNYGGWITGITSTMVTNALGYTPYNSSNPSGYITSSNWALLGTGISYNNDRTTKVSNGLAIYGAYFGGSNSPWTYDLAAQFVTGDRAFELSASWHNPSATLALRTLRDCCENWSAWVTILSSANYNSYAPSLSGSGATGSWGISITGTAGSETLSTVTSRGSTTSTSITASSFFESSDIRLKTLLEDGLDYYAISNVSTKYYEKNGKTELGYFAQDFEEILPSAVSKNEDGLLNLSYREVHTAKIAYLEEKIKQLEKLLSNGLE